MKTIDEVFRELTDREQDLARRMLDGMKQPKSRITIEGLAGFATRNGGTESFSPKEFARTIQKLIETATVINRAGEYCLSITARPQEEAPQGSRTYTP